MWKFDLEVQEWNPVPVKSSLLPPGRSEFAHGRVEETLVMFGGKGDSELLNDLYTFNLRLQEWELVEIMSENKPTPRRGSCHASADGVSLIFGGVTSSSSYTNEIWKFDWGTRSYELLPYSELKPPDSAFSNCQIELNTSNEMVFQVYTGEIPGQVPLKEMYEYNLTTHEWSKKILNSMTYSKSAAFKFKDKLIIAGGSRYDYLSYGNISMFDLNTGELSHIANLPYKTYSAASVFYMNKIYIHGGDYSFGSLPLESVMRNDLLVIELNKECDTDPYVCIPECSKGSYSNAGDCHACSKGSYSDTIGSEICNLCPRGYYSNIKGADSSRVCKQCLFGYFNDQEGQSRCLSCPNGSECSSDQGIIENNVYLSYGYTNNQPELYKYDNEVPGKSTMYFNVFIGILSCLLVIYLLSQQTTREFIKNLDLYSLQHNYGDEKVMYMRKTLIGGLFSIVLMSISLSIIFSTSITYGLDNIMESKALVPIEALKQQYENVIPK